MRQDSDTSPLAARIAEFKSDPEKLRQASEFVDQLIQQAKKEVELKQKEKNKNTFESQDSGSEEDAKGYEHRDGRVSPPTDTSDTCNTTGNLKRRFGRARGFVLRMFDALCNCTQTAAAAARTSARTNNPFTKR